ncbi:MAG: AAA family ATPase [Thermoleophilia bacterium]
MGYPRWTSSSLATPPLRADELDPAAALAGALADACARAVIAPRAVIETCVVALLSGGHVMIEDVPGVGKTVLAKSLARAAGCEYSRIQCTADLLPADVTGVTVWDQNAARFLFRPGPVFGNIVLVDEINRASPKTQSALLESMEEGQVTVDGETRPLPVPFMIVATQNPVEYEGTFPLPEAQLDRFAVQVAIGYPAASDEAAMLLDLAARDPLDAVEAVTTAQGIAAVRGVTERVHADPALAAYVVELAAATRRDPRTQLGASPRAGLALLRAAKARAVIEGRGHALPEDVRGLIRSVIPHRLILTPDARARGTVAEEIVADALDAVPVPL